MKYFVGVPYGRGGQKIPITTGCEQGPFKIKELYENNNWHMIEPDWDFDFEKCVADRFSENLLIQNKVYNFFINKDKNFIDNLINFVEVT